jgi:Polysaccharide lyase family 4, domain II
LMARCPPESIAAENTDMRDAALIAVVLASTCVSGQSTSSIPQSKPHKDQTTTSRVLSVNGTAIEGQLIKQGDTYYVSVDDLVRSFGGTIGYSDMNINVTLPNIKGQGPGQAQDVGTLGVVAGKIFAITVGGDVKPAALAKVKLLTPDAVAQIFPSGVPNPQASIHQMQIMKVDAIFIEGAELDGLHQLQTTYDKAANLAIEKPELITSTEADEYGAFTLTNVKPGKYSLVAFGHAGLNAAVWMEDITVDKKHGTTDERLNSPKGSCPDPQGLARF